MSTALGIKIKELTNRGSELNGELANYDQWAKSSLPPVCVNKVSLDHTHAHLLIYMTYGCF